MRIVQFSVLAMTTVWLLGASVPERLNSRPSIDFISLRADGEFTDLLDAVSEGSAPEWPLCVSSSYASIITAGERLEQDLLRGIYFQLLRQLEAFQATLQKLPPRVFHRRIDQLIALRDHIAKRRSYSNRILIDALNAVVFVELTKKVVILRKVPEKIHAHIGRLRSLGTDPADVLAFVAAEVGSPHSVADLDQASRKSLGDRTFEASVSAGHGDAERMSRIAYWVRDEGWDKLSDNSADRAVLFQLGIVPSLAFRNIDGQLDSIGDRDTANHTNLPALALYIERSGGDIDRDWEKIRDVLALTENERARLGSNISPVYRTYSVAGALSRMVKEVETGQIRLRPIFDIPSQRRPVQEEDAEPSGFGEINSRDSIAFLMKYAHGTFTDLLDIVSNGEAPEWTFSVSSSYALPVAAADRLEQDLLRGLYYRVLIQLEKFQLTLQKLPPRKFHKRISQLIQLRDHIAKRRSYSNQVLINALNAVAFVELAKQIVMRRDVSDEIQENIGRLRSLRVDPENLLEYLNPEVDATHSVKSLDLAARQDLGDKVFSAAVEADLLDAERFRRIVAWVGKNRWDAVTDSPAGRIRSQQLGFIPSLAFRNLPKLLETIGAQQGNIHLALPALAFYVIRSGGRIQRDAKLIKQTLALTEEDRRNLGSNIYKLRRHRGISYPVSALIQQVQTGYIDAQAIFDLDADRWQKSKERTDVE